jgi:hypothetical protein
MNAMRPGAPGAALALAALSIVLFTSCTKPAAPEDVALAYGRAVYANDADTLWRLVSEADRRVKDQATFRRQQRELRGFTAEAVRRLASYIEATPVKTEVANDRAAVTLRFRVPNANAPAVSTLMHDWDEERLERLDKSERRRIGEHLERLHRERALPIVEGDETVELVREGSGWKVFLNWAGGVRVRFAAAVDPALPLHVSVTPASIVLAPGERVRVTVTARNLSSQELTTRVSHAMEPAADATHLALLECPLLLPARLRPDQTQEYVSEYLLLADVPAAVKAFEVTYRFPVMAAQSR